MNELTSLSVSEFARHLAAKEPVPGGGGAAAMVGAYAAALCSMTGNFTTGKKKYAQYEEELQTLLEEADKLRNELMGLVDEDANAFEPLSAAYGIAKDDPSRQEKLQAATIVAIQPPLKMMKAISRSVELLERMEEIGSVMMISDVGCGAVLAGAALRSASLNVFINTGSLTDRKQAADIEQEADAMLDEYLLRAEQVAAKVFDRIRR